ncbi:TPA: hypothetical protein L7M08_000471 [Klebsiella aerogenes]|nr:hypothetical protein [Klebsiella aerogenes]
MKFLEEFFSSIAGNARTKINDPFVGTFICSWLVCNWNHLALLFWGEGKVVERISGFTNYLEKTPLIGWNQLFVIPLLIASFYLFLFPWFSLFIKFLQHWAKEKLHKQAIAEELIKIDHQKKLNMEKLKANPNKKFLEQLVQHDIDKRNLILDHMTLRTSRLEAKKAESALKTQEQLFKTQEAENNERISKLELVKKEKKTELEILRFESEGAKVRATLASNRFPSAFFLMQIVADSFKEDDVYISIKSLSSIISVLFGYADFDSLLNDKNFNNETLGKVEYIYYDEELAKELHQIVLDENSDNEDFTADFIFSHLDMLFEETPFRLITGDSLAEICKESFENNPNDIFDGDGVSGAIAMSDTIFDSVEDITLENYRFDSGFYAELSANASGEHYKEAGVPGRDMRVSITMKCPVLIGRFGLGSVEQGEVNGTLDEFE